MPPTGPSLGELVVGWTYVCRPSDINVEHQNQGIDLSAFDLAKCGQR